jgi:hypothetical protein
MISQASRRLAAAIFIVALFLIGFGVIILAFPEIFAFLAAAVFFIAGIGCGIIAIKIFLAQKRLDKFIGNESYGYTKSVEIYPDESLEGEAEDN